VDRLPHRIIEGEYSTIGQAGLYHFAILLLSKRQLANIFKHLTKKSNLLCFDGATHHAVSTIRMQTWIGT
jgi:catechol-2,3-dioxygenase